MKWLLSLCLLSSTVYASDNEVLDNYNQNYNKPTQGFVIDKPPTKEEVQIDKNFVNQEFTDKMKLDACKDLAKDSGAVFKADGSLDASSSSKSGQVNPCDETSLDTVAYVIDPVVDRFIPILGKAYGTLFGMGGSTVSYNNFTEAKGADGKVLTKGDNKLYEKVNEDGTKTPVEKKDATNKKEEKKDICAPIPMVAEMGAAAYQNMSQQNIAQQSAEKTNAELQTESLYSISRMHTARKESARIQEIGWGATSACYVGYMISGAAMDGKLIAKTAASALFTIFYDRKAKNHKDWANKIKNKADKLKALFGEKNCDPIGERQCYCSMPSTKLDPQYCVKKPKTAKGPNIATDHCIGANMQADPNCDCRAQGACFDQLLAGDMGSMNLGNTMFKNALDDVRKISNSGLDYSTLDGSTFGNLNLVKNALRKIDPKDVGEIKLNNAQKDEARFLIEQGLSPLAAAVVASLPQTEAGNQYANSLRSGLNSKSSGSNYASNNRPVESSVGFNNSNGSKKRSYDDDESPSYNVGKSNSGGGSSSSDILNFAQKAEKEAQIRKNSQTPIFDIISYRYRSSAWKTFDVLVAPPAEAPKK
jgi:hypothetical protein